jgi:hypothetical protein
MENARKRVNRVIRTVFQCNCAYVVTHPDLEDCHTFQFLCGIIAYIIAPTCRRSALGIPKHLIDLNTIGTIFIQLIPSIPTHISLKPYLI